MASSERYCPGLTSGKITSVPSDQIDTLNSSAVSIMPLGMTNRLRRDELHELLHYLMHLK